MNRWLVRICVFLLLGATVNVAVAWGCAAWATNVCKGMSIVTSGNELRWQARVPRDWPSLPESVALFPCFGITTWVAFDADRKFHQSGVHVGLPCRSMCSQSRSPSGSRTAMGYTGIRVPPSMTLDDAAWRRFPTEFLWPGFAINTVFYAVILWLLFAAPFALRRRRRIRRGLCPKCAYPVGTSDVCTECGARVRQP